MGYMGLYVFVIVKISLQCYLMEQNNLEIIVFGSSDQTILINIFIVQRRVRGKARYSTYNW